MAAPLDVFFEWLDGQDGIYEYDRGVIGMMVRLTRQHSRIVSRLVQRLGEQLNPDSHEVHAEAFAVEVGTSVRFPDIVVDRAGADSESLSSDAPLMIVEVVSRSSRYLDMVVKRDEYLKLPTLVAYVVASQDEPNMAIWRREPDGSFPAEPEPIEGFDGTLQVEELEVSIKLSALYRE